MTDRSKRMHLALRLGALALIATAAWWPRAPKLRALPSADLEPHATVAANTPATFLVQTARTASEHDEPEPLAARGLHGVVEAAAEELPLTN